MRIITVNLPVSFLKAIDALTGQTGLYPSRSELIRVAVRDFLVHELDAAKSFQKYQQNQRIISHQTKSLDDSMFVQVPVQDSTIEGMKEYKTYRLVKK
ncbi:MAG: ribbon-helix-helix domain-containing protein [Promethearchaeota archaeon]